MYRQVLVNPIQRKFQLILWRNGNNAEIDCYQLNTVTYGTTPASFLATRCLKQISLDVANQYPIASKIIGNDFYMDDLLTGCSSEAEAIALHTDISKILDQYGFTLRQWASNCDAILKAINDNTKSTDNTFIRAYLENNKTLGILWDFKQDSFLYDVNNISFNKHVSKRNILSIIAKIFDPLGLLGPIIVTGKLIIQELWQIKLSWDESVPSKLHTKWSKYQNQLSEIKNITIPRHVLGKNTTNVELHGFSDASEKAYGACIYVRSLDSDGKYSVHLLTAKSRVAPLKTVSLPRLELCGALLLTRLLQKVRETYSVDITNYICWCDSTITLNWLNSPANRWKTFVANRVSEIQQLTSANNWRHIKSNDNPADLLSRGVEPNILKDSNIWWHGPDWLKLNSNQWPVSIINNNQSAPEEKTVSLPTVTKQEIFDLFSKFSNLSMLLRVLSYCLRFIHNLKNPNNKLTGTIISVKELDNSLKVLLIEAQQLSYHSEIINLKHHKPLNHKSKILALNPFIDSEGLLRVGGRLRNSNFNYQKIHPIILPMKHKLTELIVEREHKRLLHCGGSQLLYCLRERFWLVNGRSVIRKIIHKCIDCFRANPKTVEHLMGDLPKNRVVASPPFYNCGVDYAGPINIRDKNGRGCKTIKAYICIFVCLSTKAVHLDLITSLSAEACLAVIRRFISRRGQPLNIYSDNGTNFVGANTEIRELNNLLKDKSYQNKIISNLNDIGTIWHFIPPRSPHFGGIWEAGVKSVKYHLKRIVKNSNLTFEQFYTFLTQVESVLNSRPLCPLSNDPNDHSPLTPAHFLIGRSFTSIPEVDFQNTAENRLSKYQHVQKLKQDFWKRWSKEFIGELQVRTKWKQNFTTLLRPGILVIIKEDNLPPQKWQLGRVSELHTGSDGVTRVVSIKLPSGSVYKRAVSKICVLPIYDN